MKIAPASSALGRRREWRAIVILFAIVCLQETVSGAELNIGPAQPFQSIQNALLKAMPGDVLLVHPLLQDQPYEKVALLIRQAGLTIRSVPNKPGERVRLSGEGFDYSGAGHVPRAIVQFDPAAKGCTLDGFDLSGAHNASHNGAGVRINQANEIRITHCDVHDNDMGIMSNGKALATPPTGDHQQIEHCHIHHNGAIRDSGYNHNLYLGGTSVTLLSCEVDSSLTGHNVKSRAHVTRVIDCYIHGSAEREFDLVDETGNTDLPGSDTLLLGNVIVKAKGNSGNRTVIHFGQDGGHDHNGTIYIVHNTIITPYLSPVVDLSAPHSRLSLIDNLICDGGSGQQRQVLVKDRTGADLPTGDLASGRNNLFCGGFGPQGTLGVSVSGGEVPAFVDPVHSDYHLSQTDPRVCGRACSLQDSRIPPELLLDAASRTNNADIGAFAVRP